MYYVPFVIGLGKRVRTVYHKPLLLVGFRVWENQRNFFFTGVVSIGFSESTDDRMLMGYHQCQAKDFEVSVSALF